MTRTSDDVDTPDLDQTVGVWNELERALEGRNGYGGDVAEIYAFSLVPKHLGCRNTYEDAEAQAPVAGKNLTKILRHFVTLHAGVVVEIEGRSGFAPVDVDGDGCPPFAHRVHVRVTKTALVRREIAEKLLALWNRVHVDAAAMPQPDFTAWDGATKDLLLALGMEWDASREEYVISRPRPEDGIRARSSMGASPPCDQRCICAAEVGNVSARDAVTGLAMCDRCIAVRLRAVDALPAEIRSATGFRVDLDAGDLLDVAEGGICRDADRIRRGLTTIMAKRPVTWRALLDAVVGRLAEGERRFVLQYVDALKESPHD